MRKNVKLSKDMNTKSFKNSYFVALFIYLFLFFSCQTFGPPHLGLQYITILQTKENLHLPQCINQVCGEKKHIQNNNEKLWIFICATIVTLLHHIKHSMNRKTNLFLLIHFNFILLYFIVTPYMPKIKEKKSGLFHSITAPYLKIGILY